MMQGTVEGAGVLFSRSPPPCSAAAHAAVSVCSSVVTQPERICAPACSSLRLEMRVAAKCPQHYRWRASMHC